MKVTPHTLPRHWSVKPLKYVVDFVSGGTPNKDTAAFWDGGIPWVSPKDMKRAVIDSSEDTVSEAALRATNLSLQPKGAILIVVRGMILARYVPVAETSVPVTINQDMKAMIVRGGNYPSFIRHYLSSSQALFLPIIEEAGHGTKTLRTELLGAVPIPLPPPHEQRAIVDFIDGKTGEIDALIAKQEELGARLRERREALFSSLVEHEAPTARLRFLTSILPGYAFASDTFRSEGNGVRLLRGINLRPGHLDWDDPALLDNEVAGQYARFALNIDDIVVGMDRPWISTGLRVSRIAEADLPCLLVQRVARVRCGHEIHPRFVEFTLRTKKFLAHFEPDMTGVSVPHISDTQIGDFRIPVPSYREQQRLVEIVQDEDEEIGTSLAKLEAFGQQLRERRAALITAAVTGQIEVAANMAAEAAA